MPQPSNHAIAGVGFFGLEGPVLAAKDLCKFYGSVPAVQNVSFTLEPGQVLGYLGPNGSGKSTTVKMLTGLPEPTYGEVTYDHQNIHKNLFAYRRTWPPLPTSSTMAQCSSRCWR